MTAGWILYFLIGTACFIFGLYLTKKDNPK
jgi:hypothetical protein